MKAIKEFTDSEVTMTLAIMFDGISLEELDMWQARVELRKKIRKAQKAFNKRVRQISNSY
jgi:hypothetical protein